MTYNIDVSLTDSGFLPVFTFELPYQTDFVCAYSSLLLNGGTAMIQTCDLSKQAMRAFLFNKTADTPNFFRINYLVIGY